MNATVTGANLDAFIADPKHAGRLKGSIDFSPFGSDIAASSGAFNLFSPTAKATLKHMVYELAFKHDGKDHYLAGRKQVHDGPGVDIWTDTPPLFTTPPQCRDATPPVTRPGLLRPAMCKLFTLIYP